MSQENVETVIRAFEAWNRGDFKSWSEAAHPDCEWRPATSRQFEGTEGVFRGSAEIRRFWDDSHGVWSLGFGRPDVRDLGDVVLAVLTVHATGAASGIELTEERSFVFEFEDGLIKRGTSYTSAEEALAAVDQSE
jgi:ketosteroid isomerase-like protein